VSAARFEESLRRVLRRRGTSIALKSAARAKGEGLTVTNAVTSESRTCAPPVPVKVALVDGENVLAGDLETRVAASDWQTVTPAGGLTAVIGSESYQVVEAHELRDGDTVYAYALRLRGTN
jgi:hypothetical protein